MSESNETKLRAALQQIADWQLPATGQFWDDDAKTRPVGYEAAYGSNGARDYMRQVAAAALSASSTETSGDQAPSDAEIDALHDSMFPPAVVGHEDVRAFVRTALARWGAPQPEFPSGVLLVREADGTPIQHPTYGAGVFYTEDCLFASVEDIAPQLVERKAQPVSDNGAVTSEEKLSKKYPKYYKKLPEGVDSNEVDTYVVNTMFPVEDPSGCILHARKKLLIPGVRSGGKSMADDVREARDTLTRYLALSASQAHGKSEAVAYPAMPQGYHPSQFNCDEFVWDADDMRAFADAAVALHADLPTEVDAIRFELIEVTEERDSLRAQRPAAPAADAAVVASFQQRVQPWMLACFGEMIAGDREERNHRFLEEALELVQSTGCTASEAHQLVDYVYGRPVGEPAQEVGGVMVTLAALCLANGLDMHDAAEVELARIWTKVEAIRAKQAAKPKHSPLPEAAPSNPSQSTGDSVRVEGGAVGRQHSVRLNPDVGESDGFWRSCSGCHELDEGHATGSYSPIFKCALGVGCSECGGLGAVWDDTNYEDMANFMIAQPDGEPAASAPVVHPDAKDAERYRRLRNAMIDENGSDVWDAVSPLNGSECSPEEFDLVLDASPAQQAAPAAGSQS